MMLSCVELAVDMLQGTSTPEPDPAQFKSLKAVQANSNPYRSFCKAEELRLSNPYIDYPPPYPHFQRLTVCV
jgi:hypothetical protein